MFLQQQGGKKERDFHNRCLIEAVDQKASEQFVPIRFFSYSNCAALRKNSTQTTVCAPAASQMEGKITLTYCCLWQ